MGTETETETVTETGTTETTVYLYICERRLTYMHTIQSAEQRNKYAEIYGG